MAKRGKRRKGHKESTNSKNRIMMIVVAVLVVGLIGFGMIQVMGFDSLSEGMASVVQADTGLEAVEIGSQNGQAAEPVTATDRETFYLGPASDAQTVAQAEAGQVGQPTLLWFHADWCHVCQRIKPEVIDMGEEYDGRVKIIRLNVDHGESRTALRRYGVRATPTFVMFDENGQVRGNVPGWPGYQAFTNAFDQLLTGG